MFMLICRWIQGNHKAEAMLLAISEAGPFKVCFSDSGMLMGMVMCWPTAIVANKQINTA